MLRDVSAVLGIFQHLPERVFKAVVFVLHAAGYQHTKRWDTYSPKQLPDQVCTAGQTRVWPAQAARPRTKA